MKREDMQQLHLLVISCYYAIYGQNFNSINMDIVIFNETKQTTTQQR